MIAVGRVKFVQIQTTSLKVGEQPNRRYDPVGIQRMDCLKVSMDGVYGVAANGSEIIDVHHPAHPQSKNGGDNGISIGFTSHQAAIVAKYGNHITEGIAGENIIIEAERTFSYEDLISGLAFRSADSEAVMRFNLLRDMAPCVEFSTFCAGHPLDAAEMKTTLEFLSFGQRGFLIQPTETTAAWQIKAGDLFLLMES